MEDSTCWLVGLPWNCPKSLSMLSQEGSSYSSLRRARLSVFCRLVANFSKADWTDSPYNLKRKQEANPLRQTIVVAAGCHAVLTFFFVLQTRVFFDSLLALKREKTTTAFGGVEPCAVSRLSSCKFCPLVERNVNQLHGATQLVVQSTYPAPFSTLKSKQNIPPCSCAFLINAACCQIFAKWTFT